jgi:hypothetical protein
VLDGNCAVGRGTGTDYPKIHIFKCLLERTDVITNKVLRRTNYVRSSIPHCTNTIKEIYFFYKGLKIINVDQNTL